MMQASKKIPLDNPDVLNIVRAVYVLSNIIIASVNLYISMQISGKKGTFSASRPHAEGSIHRKQFD